MSSPDATWNVSVTDAMQVFRQALIALIPSMENAHIMWRGEDVYEDWERVLESLYESIVVDCVIFDTQVIKLCKQERTSVNFATIGLSYDNYERLSYIEVLGEKQHNSCCRAFFNFATNSAPFDTIKFVLVDKRGRPIEKSIQECPAQDAVFQLRLNTARGTHLVEKELTVLL